MRWQLLWLRVKAEVTLSAVVIVSVGVAISLLVGLWVNSQLVRDTQPRATHLYVGQSAAIQQMLHSMRDATPEEIAFLKKSSSVPVASSAAWRHVYVATRDVTLAPTTVPFVFVLPPSLKWVDGPLGRATMFRPSNWNGSLPVAGWPHYEMLCALEDVGRASGDCLSKWANARPNEPWELHTATAAERRQYDVAAPSEKLLVAEGAGDLVVGTADTPLIALAPGAKATGGYPGYARFFVPQANVVLFDAFCWRGLQVAEGGVARSDDPATFVPVDSVYYRRTMQCRGNFNE